MNRLNDWPEDEGGWSLGLEGFLVTRVCVDDAVTLQCTNGRRSLALALEGPFRLQMPRKPGRTDREDAGELVPDGDPCELAPVLSLLLTTVERAHLEPEGTLEVTFSGGGRVRIEAEESFCTWRLTSGNKTVMMSMPESYAAASTAHVS